MPTDLRRINVSLPPEVDEALTRLTAATGKPQGTFIREMLVDFLPVIVELTKSMELAAKDSKRALADASALLDRAVLEARQVQLQFERDNVRMSQMMDSAVGPAERAAIAAEKQLAELAKAHSPKHQVSFDIDALRKRKPGRKPKVSQPPKGKGRRSG